MPVLSFARSKAYGFVRSPNYARNPGRGASGNGFIVVTGGPIGFMGWAGGIIDLSKWHSECHCTALRLEGSVFRRNEIIQRVPTYFHRLPPTVEVVANEQTVFGPPPQTVGWTVITTILSPLKSRTEWRAPDNSLYYSVEFEVGGEIRNYDPLLAAIDATLDEQQAFPVGPTRVDSYVLEDNGAVTKRENANLAVAQGGLVHAALDVKTTTGWPLPTVVQIFGPTPGVEIAASKRKARYLWANAALDRQVKFTVTNGASGPISILSETELPRGIEIAEPPAWPPDFYTELPNQPLGPTYNLRIAAVRRRYIIPPNTYP